jgi:hypothetical protein
MDLLPSSGKKEEQKPYLLGPLVELTSDLRLAHFTDYNAPSSEPFRLQKYWSS